MYEGITTNGHTYKVDEADVELISEYSWTKPKDGYIKKYLERQVDGKRLRKVILMHRLVMNAQEGEIVDHINGDTTDNRRSNLRITTKSVNALNTHKTRGAVPHRGVIINKKNGKYQASITINKKKYHLGFFTDVNDASEAYKSKQREVISHGI